jgi:hypothetical protein
VSRSLTWVYARPTERKSPRKRPNGTLVVLASSYAFHSVRTYGRHADQFSGASDCRWCNARHFDLRKFDVGAAGLEPATSAL